MRPEFMSDHPRDYLNQFPVIAILRGITPYEMESVADLLVNAGIRIIEVPLNSPDPFTSIELLATRFSDKCLCGAGTVTSIEELNAVHDAGGKLVVSPNTDSLLIEKAIDLEMVPVPGFATPTEAFTAISSGANTLKMFPASAMGIEYFQALRTVLPTNVPIVPTGGITFQNIKEWMSAGAAGAGIGGDLFRPGMPISKVKSNVALLVKALTLAEQDNRLVQDESATH